MSEYFETMRQFLETQERVMAMFVGEGVAAPARPARLARPAQPVALARVAEVPPAAPAVVVPPAVVPAAVAPVAPRWWCLRR
jgi:hypothetical protein